MGCSTSKAHGAVAKAGHSGPLSAAEQRILTDWISAAKAKQQAELQAMDAPEYRSAAEKKLTLEFRLAVEGRILAEATAAAHCQILEERKRSADQLLHEHSKTTEQGTRARTRTGTRTCTRDRIHAIGWHGLERDHERC